MNEYRSDNTKLVATLMALGHKLVGIDQTTPRIEWILEESPKLLEDINSFVEGTLRVEPQLMWQHFQDLKTKLYALKDMR